MYNIHRLELPMSDFQIQSFSAVIPDYAIYLAFSPKMNPKVQSFINKRLAELKSSGKLDDIIKKYI